jgi:hypothetical protein
MKMKVTSKKGKVYEYEYKQILMSIKDHNKLKTLSKEQNMTMVQLLRNMIDNYGN